MNPRDTSLSVSLFATHTSLVGWVSMSINNALPTQEEIILKIFFACLLLGYFFILLDY
jgi:hypothetical protein